MFRQLPHDCMHWVHAQLCLLFVATLHGSMLTSADARHVLMPFLAQLLLICMSQSLLHHQYQLGQG